MIGALYTGSSGVKTQSNAMTVTGSNIANANTIGYKTNRVNFQDVLATTVEGDSGQKVGQGTQIANIQAMHTQGSFEDTNMHSDMAIEGNGFFAVRDELGKMYYTRAGQFTYDKSGYLSTKSGEFLQVKRVDPDTGEAIGKMDRIKLKGIVDPPTATGDGRIPGTGVFLKANLDGNSVPPRMDLDYENVTPEMYNFSTAVNVIDVKGNEHVVNVAFRRLPDQPAQIDPVTNQPIEGTEIKGSWQWLALSPANDIEGGVGGANKVVGGGFLKFNNEGRLLTDTPGQIQIPAPDPNLPPGTPQDLSPRMVALPKDPDRPVSQVTFNFAGSGASQNIGFNFGLGSSNGQAGDSRTGLDGMTQFCANSSVKNLNVDGFKAGNLENVSIDLDGTINGHFDSGRVKKMARIYLTDFNAKEKLTQKGRNLYQKTHDSGEAIIGEPGKGKMGKIHSKTLEHSNVKLADQFVKMIEGQRSFQASAKTVSTGDEILSDLIQMKR